MNLIYMHFATQEMQKMKELSMQAHCGNQLTAMLCSDGAKGNWRCNVSAEMRQQPCSVALVLGEVVTDTSQHFAAELQQ